MTTAKKDTPGSGTSTDTSGKASTDRKSDRKDSGQKGAAEDKARREQLEQGLEKAAKHAEEHRVATPVLIAPPLDRPEVVGDEHRDVTHDIDYEPVADGTLPQHEAFWFDFDAKTKRVDHIAVASTSNVLILEVDGTYLQFDAQLAGALRRLVSAGAVNLNVTEHTFLDGGGDLGPFVERSQEYIRFADETDATCTVCHGPAGVSRQERPVYPKSGNPNQQQTSAAEVNVMKLMMDQQAELASLRAELDQKASKPGPKPKAD